MKSTIDKYINIKPLVFVIFFLITTASVVAQKTINNWYFGSSVAVTFNNGSPVSLSNSAMYAGEGCASISDDNGNLLFYTNGSTIYDSSHAVMSGATGLSGQSTSAQSAIIVPVPLSTTLYYVFTVRNWTTPSANGLSYTLVDMSQLGNGTPGVNNLGAVITSQKNFALDAEVTEQVTAMYHQNCEDIWVVAHRGNSGFSSDEYVAFLVTASGVQTTPVVSAVGMSNSGGNRFGYLRASNDGKRICSALGTGGSSFQGTTVEVLDFDNSTGIVSNPIVIADGGSINSAYSAEFSPDDNLLYVVSYNGTHIYQFDLSSGVQSTIQASKTDIASGNEVKPCLQIGPDKKIYVALRNSAYLGVIDQPNSIGQACSFSSQAVVLSGSNSGLGLPTFLKPLYEQTNQLAIGCDGDSVLLAASFYQPGSNISYLWYDSLTSHDHIVSQSGTYWVSGFDGNCYYQDTFEVLLHDLPDPDTGEDTCICLGEDVVIGSAPVANWDYFWQPTGTTSSSFLAEPVSEQVYVLNVIDTTTGCQGVDSVVVCVNPLPDIQALSDTTIMEGGDAYLNATGGANYIWSSNLTIDCPDCPQIQVSPDSTTYFYLSGTDSNGCSGMDTVLVNVIYNDTLFVPNLFSPNLDGNNDILYVRTFGMFENVHFRLFNRWGKLVFETMDESIGWDGYFEGVLQPVDVYVYHLTASTLDGQTFIQKGDITLLR